MPPTMHVAPPDGPSQALLAKTILVVEDEELVRETISAELQDAGFVVLEAETAEQGLEVLEKKAVGVLFTDIRLPGRADGWDLAEKARSLYPNLPVIYATGFSAEEPRFVPESVFLRKPYLPSAVLAAIEKLIKPPQAKP
jgi:CheY-like chemotaxis protein